VHLPRTRLVNLAGAVHQLIHAPRPIGPRFRPIQRGAAQV